MFVYTVKIKWWRVLGFVLLVMFLVIGGYFLSEKGQAGIHNSTPVKEEIEGWQV